MWNRGYGPYLRPLLVFLKLDRNTKQIAMQLIKTSNAEDIEEYQEESGVTLDTKTIKKHHKTPKNWGPHSVTLSYIGDYHHPFDFGILGSVFFPRGFKCLQPCSEGPGSKPAKVRWKLVLWRSLLVA
jgi:hypothetical protein